MTPERSSASGAGNTRETWAIVFVWYAFGGRQSGALVWEAVAHSTEGAGMKKAQVITASSLRWQKAIEELNEKIFETLGDGWEMSPESLRIIRVGTVWFVAAVITQPKRGGKR
jgi:hypothetical protein